MLTSDSAAEFRVASHAGSIRRGGDEDLIILAVNPAAGDLRGSAHVLIPYAQGGDLQRARKFIELRLRLARPRLFVACRPDELTEQLLIEAGDRNGILHTFQGVFLSSDSRKQ